MKRLIPITIIFTLFSLSLASLTQERRVQVTTKEKRLALVIGNNNYATGKLANAVNDARAIKNTLKELGFSVIYLENASLRDMISSVQELERKLRAGEVGLFYFSGHGIRIDGLNYLLPVGVNIKSEADVKFECYPADRVIESMTNSKNRLNIVILDACRDNPFARSFSRSSSKGLAQMSSGKGMLIAYATSPGDTASDGPGLQNGLFTHHLLKSMKTPGLNLEQVFTKTREAVNDASNGKQLPWTSSSIIGEFVFSPISSTGQTAPSYKPKLPVSPKVDFSDIEAEARKNREAREKEIKAWSDWQKEFQEQVNKVKQIEKDENISAGLKKEAWERILNAYQDNPYSSEDEQLKNEAKERISYWEKKTTVYVPSTTFSGIRLRSSYTNLSENEVGSMLKNKGFFSKQMSYNSEYCNPVGDFNNQYESKIINGDKVVIDHTTGLMWHQSGSSETMKYKKAEKWIRDLNNREYAGYNDWRLPTLEEGASLLESSQQNGNLYIDPVFSDSQLWIWTGDKFGSGEAWFVNFSDGRVNAFYPSIGRYVRPVRPEQ